MYRRVFLRPYSDFPTLQEAYDSTEIIYSEDVELTEEEIEEGVKRGGRWITYSVWEMEEEPAGGWTHGGKGRGRDLVLIHGEYPILTMIYPLGGHSVGRGTYEGLSASKS